MLSDRVTFFSFMQFENIEFGTYVSPPVRVALSSSVQLKNIPFPYSVSPESSVISVRDVYAKAKSFISVTLSGMVREVMPLQF